MMTLLRKDKLTFRLAPTAANNFPFGLIVKDNTFMLSFAKRKRSVSSLESNCTVLGNSYSNLDPVQYSIIPLVSTEIMASNTGLYFIKITGCVL